MRIAFKSYDKILPLSKLKTSRYQRNQHTKAQIKRLAKLMRENGVRQAIHVSRQTGEICFGHGRLEAAKLNGWTEFPVVYQTFQSEKEEYACVQSDNAIAEWSALDLEGIETDIENFGDDFDVELLGIKNFSFGEDETKDTEGVLEIPQEYILSVYAKSEQELQEIYEEMKERGFECKIIM